MPRKLMFYDIDNLVSRYNAGESILALHNAAGLHRGGITKCLRTAGVKFRTMSEAQTLKNARLTPAQRQAFSKAAHDAIRGVRQSEEHRCKIARTVESRANPIGMEKICIDLLREKGISCAPQKAIGRFNVDIALTEFRIAVEIFGGHWHASGTHATRFRRRHEYILDAGWLPIYVWISKNYPLQVGAIDYIVTLTKTLDFDEALWRHEHMIRGDGKPCAVGKKNFV